MKGETTCWYCDNTLNILNTVRLLDDKKICTECHSSIKRDLGLNMFNSKNISIEDINTRYAELGRNLENEHNDLRLRKDDIKTTGIYTKVTIDVAAGGSAIGVSGPVTIVQLNDNRIAINPKNPDFYYLLSTEFNGAKYKTVLASQTAGGSSTDTTENTVKKGKTGRIAAGAVIGTMLGPVGTVVGAYAGSKGKDKKKVKGNKTTRHNSNTTQTTEAVEVKSLAKINLKRISDDRSITLTINADTRDYNELLSLQTVSTEIEIDQETGIEEPKSREDIIKELKELKELVDMGIVTQEEFDAKKKELLNL
ncbi:SHOCT domain-containing protein [Enterococcus sp. AZ103]|uniref:SHOCT domain-containing protein n=1 Tax=Enterococcus sp. AZ103 TaxID=2774628 RepID=UPI003F29CE49